jgi:hypothetical protein
MIDSGILKGKDALLWEAVKRAFPGGRIQLFPILISYTFVSSPDPSIDVEEGQIYAMRRSDLLFAMDQTRNLEALPFGSLNKPSSNKNIPKSNFDFFNLQEDPEALSGTALFYREQEGAEYTGNSSLDDAIDGRYRAVAIIIELDRVAK